MNLMRSRLTIGADVAIVWLFLGGPCTGISLDLQASTRPVFSSCNRLSAVPLSSL